MENEQSEKKNSIVINERIVKLVKSIKKYEQMEVKIRETTMDLHRAYQDIRDSLLPEDLKQRVQTMIDRATIELEEYRMSIGISKNEDKSILSEEILNTLR